jgi:DNA-directed RNA polymerase subunit RPC12/RpoP
MVLPGKLSQCPGARRIREPSPEYYTCPNCGAEVEVWSHELFYPCDNCKTPVFREKKASCIDWCQYAKECVGEETYNRLKGIADQSQQDMKVKE